MEPVAPQVDDSTLFPRSVDERPRERLFRLGALALRDAELVALVLGTGARGRSALAIAEQLTREGLKAFFQQDPDDLCSQHGLGPARVARILAAVELGRRAQRVTEKRPRLKSPQEIFRYLTPTLSTLRREVFHVLSFNAKNVLLLDQRVAEGTACSCPVDPKDVFKSAIRARAQAMVFAHNHPSGDPEPSGSDLELTQHLVQGAGFLGIHVLDHLILGDGGYVSLLERGHLPLSSHKATSSWNGSRSSP